MASRQNRKASLKGEGKKAKDIEAARRRVQEAQRMLEALELGSDDGDDGEENLVQAVYKEEMANITDDDDELRVEVAVVDGHEWDHGRLKFRVRLKHHRTSEWMYDDDLDCDDLVNEYLHSRGMTTQYIVCRVSTKKQTEELHTSLDAQLAAITGAVAASPNVRRKVVRISASAFKRVPKQLVAALNKAGQGDSVYFWRVDRMSRNILGNAETGGILSLLDQWHNAGVSIHSVFENIVYADNQIAFADAILQGHKESMATSARVKASLQYRLQVRGDERVGGLPYGEMYQTQPGGRKVVVQDPVALQCIEYIRQHRNLPAKLIAHRMRHQGMTKKGKPWTTNMVQRRLKYKE